MEFWLVSLISMRSTLLYLSYILKKGKSLPPAVPYLVEKEAQTTLSEFIRWNKCSLNILDVIWTFPISSNRYKFPVPLISSMLNSLYMNLSKPSRFTAYPPQSFSLVLDHLCLWARIFSHLSLRSMNLNPSLLPVVLLTIDYE